MNKTPFLLFIFIFVLFSLSSCDGFSPKENIIDRIEIDDASFPKEVGKGNVNNVLDNLIIIVYYTNGSSSQIKFDKSMISKEDIEKLQYEGEHEIGINYNGYNTSFTITIDEKGSLHYSCEVLFIGLDNNIITSIIIDESVKNITFPTAPFAFGYEFVSWDSNTFDIIRKAENGIQTISVYAIYQPLQSYTASFYDKDGNLFYQTEFSKDNPLQELPAVNLIDGFIFKGFSMTLEEINSQSSDVSIYLIYEEEIKEKTYKITFMNEYGLFISSIELKEDDNKVDFPPVPYYDEGYIFEKWSMTEEEILSLKQDVTVYAIFNRGISLYILDYTGQIVYQSVFMPGEFTEFPKMKEIVNGHKFLGFNMTLEEINNSSGTVYVSGEYEYVGVFNLYFYDFNNNLIKMLEYHPGDKVEVTPPEVEGYTFNGWDFDFDQVNEDSYIYPVYNKNFEDEDSFYVVYKSVLENPKYHSREKLGPIERQTYQKGDVVCLPDAPKLDGYSFVCWDVPCQKLAFINSNTVINAIYIEEKVDQVRHKVSIFGLDNTLLMEMYVYSDLAQTMQDYYLSLVCDIPNKKGYRFVGFDIELIDAFCMKDDVNVYARYELTGSSTEVKVTFYDFYGNIATEYFVTSSDQIVFPEPPIIPGYKFVEWTYDEMGLIDLSYDLGIFPYYEKEVHNLNLMFIDINNEVFYETLYIDYFNMPTAPVIQGKRFLGYNKSFDEIKKSYDKKESSLQIKAIYCDSNVSTNYFTVIFESKLTGAIIDAIRCEKGEFSKELYPIEPTYNGYVFTKWSLSPRSINNIGSDLNEVYVSAEYYKENEYDLEYRIDFYDYYNELFDVRFYKGDEKVKYPEPNKVDKMTFVSWDKEIEYLTQNEEVHAIYELTPKRTIRFYGKNNELIHVIKLYNDNDKVESYPDAPSYDNFVFAGWDYPIDSINRASYINEVRATYREMSDSTIHRVTFLNANGHYYTSFDIKYGETFDLPDKLEPYNNMVFGSWDKTFEEMINTYLDVYVMPVYVLPTDYKVTFVDLDENIIYEKQYNEITIRNVYYPDPPYVAGFTFEGWSIDINELINNFNGDTVIKPIFKQNITKVRFVTEFNELLKEVDYYAGDDIEYPTPETAMQNVRFDRWNYSVASLKEKAKSYTTLDVIAYFKEFKVINFLTPNGGLIETREVLKGSDNYPIAPTYYGYEFVKWSPSIDEVFDQNLDCDIYAYYERINMFLGTWIVDNVFSPYIHSSFYMEIDNDYIYFNGIKMTYRIDLDNHFIAHASMWYVDGLVDIELEFKNEEIIFKGLETNYIFHKPMPSNINYIQISKAKSLSNEEIDSFKDKVFRVYGVVAKIDEYNDFTNVFITDDYGDYFIIKYQDEYIASNPLTMEAGDTIYVDCSFEYQNNEVCLKQNSYQIVYTKKIPQFFVNVCNVDKYGHKEIIDRISFTLENKHDFISEYEFLPKGTLLEVVDLRLGYDNCRMYYTTSQDEYYQIKYQANLSNLVVNNLDFLKKFNHHMLEYKDDSNNLHSFYIRDNDDYSDIEYYYNKELVGNSEFNYKQGYQVQAVISGTAHTYYYNKEDGSLSINGHKLIEGDNSILLCRIKFKYDDEVVYNASCIKGNQLNDIPSLSIVPKDDNRIFIGWDIINGSFDMIKNDQTAILKYVEKSNLNNVVGKYELIIDGNLQEIVLYNDNTYLKKGCNGENHLGEKTFFEESGYYEFNMSDEHIILIETNEKTLNENDDIVYEKTYVNNYYEEYFNTNGYSLRKYDSLSDQYVYYVNNLKTYPNYDYYFGERVNNSSENFYSDFGNDNTKFELSYDVNGHPVYKYTVYNGFITINNTSGLDFMINYKESETDSIRNVFTTSFEFNQFGFYNCPNGLVTIIYEPVYDRVSYEVHDVMPDEISISEILQLKEEALSVSPLLRLTLELKDIRNGYAVLTDGTDEILAKEINHQFSMIQKGQRITILSSVKRITINDEKVNILNSSFIEEVHEFNLDVKLIEGEHYSKDSINSDRSYKFTVNDDGSCELFEIRNNQYHIKQGYVVGNYFVVTLYEYRDNNYVISKKEGTLENPVEEMLISCYTDHISVLSVSLYKDISISNNYDYYLYLLGADTSYYINDYYKLVKQSDDNYVLEINLPNKGLYSILKVDKTTGESEVYSSRYISVDKPSYIFFKYSEKGNFSKTELRKYNGTSATIGEVLDNYAALSNSIYKYNFFRVDGYVNNVIDMYQGKFTIVDNNNRELLIENVIPNYPTLFFSSYLTKGMRVTVVGRIEMVDNICVMRDAHYDGYNVLSDRGGRYKSEDERYEFIFDYLNSINNTFTYYIRTDGYIDLCLRGRVIENNNMLYLDTLDAYSFITGEYVSLDPNNYYMKKLRYENGYFVIDDHKMFHAGEDNRYIISAYDYNTKELLKSYMYYNGDTITKENFVGTMIGEREIDDVLIKNGSSFDGMKISFSYDIYFTFK